MIARPEWLAPEWIPELLGMPGFYAASANGVATTDASRALIFGSYERAAQWCKDHPHPMCVPVERDRSGVPAGN